MRHRQNSTRFFLPSSWQIQSNILHRQNSTSFILPNFLHFPSKRFCQIHGLSNTTETSLLYLLCSLVMIFLHVPKKIKSLSGKHPIVPAHSFSLLILCVISIPRYKYGPHVEFSWISMEQNQKKTFLGIWEKNKMDLLQESSSIWNEFLRKPWPWVDLLSF